MTPDYFYFSLKSRAFQKSILCLGVLTFMSLGADLTAQENEPSFNLVKSTDLTIFTANKSRKMAEAACISVQRIEIKNIQFFLPENLRILVEPHIQDCIDNESVKKILGLINEAYAQKGYITTQGYLPEQDIKKSKTLLINIIPGRINKIDYHVDQSDEARSFIESMKQGWDKLVNTKGIWDALTTLSWIFDRLDDPVDRFQILPITSNPQKSEDKKNRPFGPIETSIPLDVGDVVDINLLQHGVDQINRTPSAHAEVKLEAGDAPATSTIVVKNKVEDSFRASIGYEINGSTLNGSGTTGPSRLRLDIAKDNLIGINDIWKTSYAGGLDSNEIKASVSVPYHRLTFSFDTSYSESLSQITSGVDLMTRDVTASGSASYLLRRLTDVQTNLETSMSWRNGERFLNGFSLTPQTIAQIRLGVSEMRTFDNLLFGYGIGFNQGLTVLGATHDPANIGLVTPRAQFFKMDGNISLSEKFDAVGMVKLDLSGQWTKYPLYSDDQLVLGSISTVRGFTNTATRADRGALIRFECAPYFPANSILGKNKETWVFLNEFLGGIQPYGFSDFGYGQDIANKYDVQRASLGTGLRFQQGRTSLDVSISEPVYRRGGAKINNWQSPEAYLTLAVKIF